MSLASITYNPLSNCELARWFAEQVLPHETALRNWLRHRFPALGDWDDIIQESYLRLWRARSSGPLEHPKAYLFTTARNLALNRLQEIQRKAGLREYDFSTVLKEEAGTSEQVARHQEIELLNRALQSLPDRCREIFILRRIYGLSQKQIAAQLGIGEKTVETQAFIAMKKCVAYFEQIDRVPAARALRLTTLSSAHG